MLYSSYDSYAQEMSNFVQFVLLETHECAIQSFIYADQSVLNSPPLIHIYRKWVLKVPGKVITCMRLYNILWLYIVNRMIDISFIP